MEEPVMYILVNQNVKLPTGKLAAQVAHSACKMVAYLERLMAAPKSSQEEISWYDTWRRGSYVKLVVKAPEDFLKKMTNKYLPATNSHIFTMHTRDEGRTAIPSGTLTTVVFNPAPRSELPEELLELKLL